MIKKVSVKTYLLKSGKKSYGYCFEIAPKDGKRQWSTKRGFKTRAEANRAGILAQRQYEDTGRVSATKDISFSDFLDIWFKEDCEVELKATTLRDYKKKINNHIRPALGDYYLRSIKREMLQTFIAEMYDKGYSRNTLSSIIGLLTKSFNFAMDNNYIQYSPAMRIRIPKNRAPKVITRSMEREYIPDTAIEQILQRFPETSSSNIPLRLGYECGLRIGEAFALVWEDIDFENKTLSVNRQVQWQKDTSRSTAEKELANGSSECGSGYWYFDAPKCDSYRTIELNDSLCQLLEREKARQESMRAYYGEYYSLYYSQRPLTFGGKPAGVVFANPISNDNRGSFINFVCVRPNGEYISSRTMQHTSRVIRDSIFDKFTYHALRHTHASKLYEAGLTDKYISERLGHKDISVTREVYIHLTSISREQSRAVINKIFDGVECVDKSTDNPHLESTSSETD